MKVDIEKIKAKKSLQELFEFGIINIDKPSGPTSFKVSDFVRKTLGIKKTSHFGTLDPKVTGVLPIALNRACKLTGFFIGKDKEYVGIMRIHKKIEPEKIKEVVNEKFVGKIKQIPPVKSRVKRQEREREIKRFDILGQKNLDFLFLVECEAGTYIRKLIHDIGVELVVGAHMLELRRIRAGIFKEYDKNYPSINLYDFESAVEEYKKGNDESLRRMIIPAETISEIYPSVNIKKEAILKLFNGSPLFNRDVENKSKFEKEKIICLFSGDRFIGMYSIVNQGEIFAKPKFVLQPIKNENYLK